MITGALFGLMLFIGFYARLIDLSVASQDAVVVTYITKKFELFWWGPYLKGMLSIGLLAAGLSTLDGILVSLSSMITTDFLGPMMKFDDKKGLSISRYILVAVGIVGLLLAWNPPKYVGLFAQKGVYALAAASLVPFLAGVMRKSILPVPVIFTASLSALFVHFYLNLFAGVTNPAVSGTWAILTSLTIWATYEIWAIVKKTDSPQSIIDHKA
jgi:SSS family solute:Na+ symporter/sodium/pantothenate symporter